MRSQHFGQDCSVVGGIVNDPVAGAPFGYRIALDGVASIPGEVLAVRLEQLEVDVTPVGAVATGIQFAQVHVHGQLIDDRRGFVDWFVRDGGNGGCRPPSTSRRRQLKKTNQVETVDVGASRGALCRIEEATMITQQACWLMVVACASSTIAASVSGAASDLGGTSWQLVSVHSMDDKVVKPEIRQSTRWHSPRMAT